MNTVRNIALRSHLSILLILSMAAGLYIYQLSDSSLWIDEFSSIYDAQRLPEGLQPTRPLYYILLRFWMIFGTSVEWLRGLSVIFGMGGVFLIYKLGFRVAGKATGNVAAILLACSPLVINHVQEVRMYSLGNFLSILGSILLLEALDRPTAFTVSKWVAARVLATLTIPLSILLLVPDVLIIGWRLRHKFRALKKFVVGLVAACILLLPSATSVLLKAGPSFVSDWTAKLPKPGLAAIVSKLTNFTAFWPLTALPQSLPIKALYYAYTLILAVLIALAILKARRQSSLIPIVAWALLPAAIILIFSYAVSPIWNGRYLLFLSPYVLVLLAVSFIQLWCHYRQIAVIVLLIYVLAVGGGLNQYYFSWDRDDWKSAVEAVREQENEGDAVAVSAPLADPKLAVEYYYQGSAPVYSLDSFQGKIDQTEVTRVLGKIPMDSARLWIVYRGINGNSQANRLVEQVIETQFDVQSHQQFAGPVDLFLVTEK